MTKPAKTDEPQADLDTLLGDLHALEERVSTWEAPARSTVEAIKRAVDALNRTAFERLIRAVKDEPAALEALKRAVSDEVVYAVLRHHELVRPSLHERVERALAAVRPMLESHGGDVELVAVTPPDTVEIRLLGACDGCPASSVTLAAGVEQAIREHCPEIASVRQARGTGVRGRSPARYISPFANDADPGWIDACGIDDVPQGGLLAADVAGRGVILSRLGGQVVCYENACAHLAMPLDRGTVADGVLTCPHHGFRYRLQSGECLTAPEVQLHTHAVSVSGSRVRVKLS